MHIEKKVSWNAIIATCLLAISLLAGCVEQGEGKTLKVFHAGSLAAPLGEVEREFEQLYPEIDVQRESYGSVEAIRQITEAGKKGDVLASADYTLIPDMMYDEYAEWVIRFATNDMVLAYNSEKSRYAESITAENWHNILRRSDVTFGFSNPNLDPCGYRAMMVCQLAELYYNDSRIFDDLIMNNTLISVEDGDEYLIKIKVPENLGPDARKVTIKPKEAELTSLVEMGGLDYYFIYRSVAVQHNLSFVDLPGEIDLSKVEYEDLYKKIEVETADGSVKVGKPIVYGITVPKNAESLELGLEFVRFVTSKEGQEIFSRNGQPPIVPPVGSGDLPESLGVKETLKLATGSPYELGLIDALAEPFEERYNCKVEVTKAGSGKSLDLGREGKVDLVMVHSPEEEERFIADKHGLDRAYVMSNDFVIVGPEDDPAGIRGMTNATEAYKKIAETRTPFFSRGDNSGTHKKEMSIWKDAGITPKGEWYRVTHSFMATTLEMANEEQGYFMTDRSTYITLKDKIDLDILVEGDPELVNHYHAIAVNPAKHSNVNYVLAKAFIDYLTSTEGKRTTMEFGTKEFGEPLYYVMLQRE